MAQLYDAFFNLTGLHVYATLPGVVIFHVAFGLPFGIFLMRNFYTGIPKDLLEAGRIDGAGEWTLFRRVVLPLGLPAAASLAIFQFIWVWNDLLVGLVFLGGNAHHTLTIYLFSFTRTLSNDYWVIATGGIISILVPLVDLLLLPALFRPRRARRGGQVRQLHVPCRPQGPDQALRRRQPRGRPAQPGGGRRRVRLPGRAVGLRQDHRAPDDRRPGGHLQRAGADRREGGQPAAPARPRHRPGLPELRPLPAHERVRQHGLRPAAAQDAQAADRDRGARGGPHPRPGALPRPQARPALRRPAPARGPGAGHRPRARRLPDGRAPLQPRRQAARADPGGDSPAAPAAQGDHDLRDPRPGRGDDHGRPHRRDQRGRAPAGGDAEGSVRAARQPVRGGLHRLTVDELRGAQGGGGPGARGWSATARRWSSTTLRRRGCATWG